ncbi:hypothetical protein [Eleftheria terrae]|uniref:hypothetical protein n=1 Tax=Eleftheria terrae TaxID=1597781 RepID=UPI00263B306B|nr:hypothetical protein [Eleftheria terrae]WKB52120.1 hypothetical protein N7L95_20340 [Eleftheria terrae]
MYWPAYVLLGLGGGGLLVWCLVLLVKSGRGWFAVGLVALLALPAVLSLLMMAAMVGGLG